MQIVSKSAHNDKRPMNAMIAKAVELCSERNIAYLIYGQYIYGKNDRSPLVEFKRRNGFEKLDLPRYYIPLTLKGKLALKTGVHRGMKHFIPIFVFERLLKLRSTFYRLASNKIRSTSN